MAPVLKARTANQLRGVSMVAGLVALTGFICQLWFYSEGFRGRLAFLLVAERALTFAWWLVVLPFLVCAVTGLLTIAKGFPDPASGEPARVFDLVLRIIALIFVGLFAYDLIDAADLASDPARTYDQFAAVLGRPFHLIVYVTGLTSVALSVALAVPRWIAVVWPSEGVAMKPAAQWVGGLLAAMLWLSSINVLAYYATGRAFVVQRLEEGAPAEKEASEKAPPAKAPDPTQRTIQSQPAKPADRSMPFEPGKTP